MYMNKKSKKKNKSHNQKKVKKRPETLSEKVEVERIEEKQKNAIEDDDKEQRRNTRLGAIIAIVAIVGTACAFLFKMTISTLNVWSEQGLIYWYLKLFFLSALSIAIILFIDIAIYVICDLKRHNISNVNYRQYDKISDDKYKYLLSELKQYIIIFLLIYSLILPLSVIYDEKDQRWSSIVGLIFCLVLEIAFLIIWIKGKNRIDVFKAVISFAAKIAEMVGVGVLCFVFGLIFVTNSKTTINVQYRGDGIVEICNTSSESYGGLDITIHSMKNELLFEKSVGKEEVLFAREDKYVNSEVDGKRVAEGLLINSEWLHWKYIYDLKEIVDEPGKYYISVTAHQDGKSVLLLNSFLVENKEYTFAKDNMKKEY